jgi:RHS repeat-associated protein
VLLAALLLGACAPTPVPSPSTQPPSASPPTTGFTAASLALEACDLAADVPCEHQAATLELPIAGSGLALTYSSERAPGRTDRPPWDAGDLGLGGWSLDVLERYDAANGVVLDGDGSWRLAEAVPLSDGEQAVASYDGRRVAVFDVKGRHVRTVDALLGVTLLVFTYDGAGRLTGVHGSLDSQPIQLTVDRAADGTPRRLLGADGAATDLALDGSGHLTWIRDPTGGAAVISSTGSGLVTSYADAAGGVTWYAYDDVGRLSSLTDPDGVTLRYDRQASAERVEVRVTTPLGRVRVYRAERVAGSLQRTSVAASGATTTLATDPGRSGTLTLPDGTTRTFGLQPDPRFGLQAPIRTPLVEARPDGVQRRTEVAVVAATGADPLRLTRWSRATTIDGHAWTETLDPPSRTISTTDPVGRRSTRGYDDAGRIVLITEAGRPDRAVTYDAVGRLATDTLGHGPTAATTRYGYDPATGLLTITRPDGTVDLGGVDADGRVVRGTTADGATVQLAYDPAGRLIQVRPPGQPSFTLGRSAAGRSTGFLAPVIGDDQALEVRRHDQDGAVTAIDGPGDRAIAVSYDAAGRPISWQSRQGTSTATYDLAGRPSTLAAPSGITTQAAYAGALPAGLTWSGPVAGDVSLVLDAMGRTTSQSVDGTDLSFGYDAAGLLTGIGDLSLERDPTSGLPIRARVGSTETTWSYDADGSPTRSTTTVGGALVLDQRFERDALRRITAITETRGGRQPTWTAYGYDPAGRLATVRRDGTLVEQDRYDPAGNRISVTTSAGTLAAVYDDRDRLETWGSVRYAYRPDGTLASRTDGAAVTAYVFDDFGALTAVTLPDGRKIGYFVDGAGRRVGRSVDGRLAAGYLYRPDGRVVGGLDGSGALIASFAYDDRDHLALIERDGRAYRVVTDQLGSPLLVLDASTGQVVESLAYDAWGRVISDTKPGFQPFGFAGGLRDPDTGLVHFGARDYDPLTGRWTSPDPIRFAGGDANLYRYASGDPLDRVDPTGLDDYQLITCDTNGCTSAPIPDPGGGGAPPPPPPPPNGSGDVDPGSFFSCSGFYCSGPNLGPGTGGGCIRGGCGMGPNGFTCRANVCGGPNGEVCVGTPCSIGEPHFRTAHGRHLDFQGAGEYLAIVSADESVVVQVRQEPYGGAGLVSINTAVAASVGGDRVAVYTDDDRPLTIDGKVETRNDLSVRLPHGGIVERHGTVVTVDWPGGSRLTVTRDGAPGAHLDYGFAADPTVAPTISGLLGTAAGDVANDLTGRDGHVLDPADPDFATRLYREFGQSWRIGQPESLFDYRPGESTATFTIQDFPRAPAAIEGLDEAVRATAEGVCRAVGVRAEPALSDCILDVGITGDPSYAASAAAVQAATGVSTPPPPGSSPGPSPTPEPSPSIPTSSPRSGGAVTPGEAVNGSIASVGQRDRYTFPGTAGQVVYLEAFGCVNGLRWHLLGPDGRELGLDRTCADLGRRVLGDAGTYTVEILSDGTATGAYGFQLLDVPAVTTSAIRVGETVTGTIARIGEWHRYTYPATAGQIVYLRQQGLCRGGLRWAVLRPDERVLTFEDGCHDLGRRILPDSGTYTIQVYGEDATTGAYGFQLLDVPAVTTSAIRVGDTVTGTIARIGEWHRYTFAATAGQVVALEATAGCVDGLRWRLLGPDGRELGLDRSCVDLGRRVLSSAGTYTVEIYSDGTATGAYGFRLRSTGP